MGDAALAERLASDLGRGRVDAIHRLSGGNHRFLTMLYPFLAGDGLTDLVDPFVRMLDRELTPYYQERLRWQSSPQQRALACYLARAGEPKTMSEIARDCFITEQTASKQLRELEGLGFTLLTRAGRQTLCEISEPLLRMVLQYMDDRDGPVRQIVRVLRGWYSPCELPKIERHEGVHEAPGVWETPGVRRPLPSPPPSEESVREALWVLEAGGAGNWDAVRHAMNGIAGAYTSATDPELRLIAEAFLEIALDSCVPAELPRGVWTGALQTARDAIEDALFRAVKSSLPRTREASSDARRVVDRITAVFGQEGLPGQACRLLQAAVAYVEADFQERAIMNLSVELRGLILEPYGRERGESR